MNMYDRLAPVYHLLFSNWEYSIKKGAEDLDAIIKEYCLGSTESILDVSCGIGTQIIGLAEIGYSVTGSDLSEMAVQRARNEAIKRELNIDLSVADMRNVSQHHNGQYDVVMSCHNSVTHLQTDQDILKAFMEFYALVKYGGICLIGVRDYDNEERGTGIFKPFGVRIENNIKYVVFQIWDFEGSVCDVSLYILKDDEKPKCQTSVFRTRYFAIGISRLIELMQEVGFSSVKRLDDCLNGPIIVGKKPSIAAVRQNKAEKRPDR